MLGSPPRMRGKAKSTGLETLERRITPAYAGKSALDLFGNHAHGDHPRVCGEKKELICSYHDGEGSPPRMRGKEITSNDNDIAARITPAYAGKSVRRR